MVSFCLLSRRHLGASRPSTTLLLDVASMLVSGGSCSPHRLQSPSLWWARRKFRPCHSGIRTRTQEGYLRRSSRQQRAEFPSKTPSNLSSTYPPIPHHNLKPNPPTVPCFDGDDETCTSPGMHEGPPAVLKQEVGQKRKMDQQAAGRSSVGSAVVPGLELLLTAEEEALFTLLMQAMPPTLSQTLQGACRRASRPLPCSMRCLA